MAKPKQKTKPKKSTKAAKKPAKKSAKKAAKKPAKKPAKKSAKPAAKKSAKKPATKKPNPKRPVAAVEGELELAGTPDGDPGASGGSNGVPPANELAKLAMAGDVDAIFAIMNGEAESDRDGLAYKWLAVASDFGHEAAGDMMDDLLEVSSLRYDDDQLVTGAAHWELGLAYLTGGEGLPRDLVKGRAQLAAALERGFPASIQDSDKEIAEARGSFQPDALEVFDAVYAEAASGAHDDRGDEGDDADEG